MKDTNTVKVSKKDSILFQLSSLNLLMLIAFVVVMIMVMQENNRLPITFFSIKPRFRKLPSSTPQRYWTRRFQPPQHPQQIR